MMHEEQFMNLPSQTSAIVSKSAHTETHFKGENCIMRNDSSFEINITKL